MSDSLNFGELDEQHVELLPARTVLSMVSPQLHVGDATSTNTNNGKGMSALSMLETLGGVQSHGADGAAADG